MASSEIDVIDRNFNNFKLIIRIIFNLSIAKADCTKTKKFIIHSITITMNLISHFMFIKYTLLNGFIRCIPGSRLFHLINTLIIFAIMVKAFNKSD